MTENCQNVLSHYPPSITRLAWNRLGSAGGFSGAILWSGKLDGVTVLALKCWPEGYPEQSLIHIHHLMNVARNRFGLAFVPPIVTTREGKTVVRVDGRVWDLTSWMPGTASYRSSPSIPKLEAVCTALAALHRSWMPSTPEMAACPGVLRRLGILAQYPAMADQPACDLPNPEWNRIIRRAHTVLPPFVSHAIESLQPWLEKPVPLHYCHCDLWHDHVLFIDDQITGILDYGSVKKDNAAIDLARLLGDLVGDDEHLFRVGVEAYRRGGGPVPVDETFTRALDRTGLVCGVVRWVRDLSSIKSWTNASAAVQRLEHLLTRLEGWPVAIRR